MYESCIQKQQNLIEMFSSCRTSGEKYKKIMALGKQLDPVDEKDKVSENTVPGCQSLMYLKSWEEKDGIFFRAGSDALISAGLAQMMILIYNGESAEVILKCEPSCFEKLELVSALSPGRSNGLASIYLKMKQEAIRLLTQKS